jgi:hypothetical protein
MSDPSPRYHLVQHVDGDAGFCAVLTYTLNGIRMAVRDGAIPVVYYGREATRFFYDPSHGDNVWEYYFEPVTTPGYAQLRAAIERGEITPDRVHSFTRRQICDWHHSDPDRIATFWAKDVPGDPAAWMAAKRALGRKYVSEFFRVKPHILAKVDAFWNAWIRPQFTIGVHIRGTDFAYAEPTGPFAYFEAIDRYLAARGAEPYRIFLATDQNQFVDLFRERYGERVVTYDCLRSNRARPAFKFSSESPYRRGEDVLVDVLLLSRCDFLFKGAAAGGEFALWFNPQLRCHDFALESRFDPRPYRQLVSAFRKLDIAQWSPSWWSPRRWRREWDDLRRSAQRRLERLARRGQR